MVLRGGREACESDLRIMEDIAPAPSFGEALSGWPDGGSWNEATLVLIPASGGFINSLLFSVDSLLVL